LGLNHFRKYPVSGDGQFAKLTEELPAQWIFLFCLVNLVCQDTAMLIFEMTLSKIFIAQTHNPFIMRRRSENG
jgi:hypothetical protein